MIKAYLKHCEERKSDNLPPLALDAKQTKSVVESLISGLDDDFYLNLLTHRVPPGVDEAAYVKAGFLALKVDLKVRYPMKYMSKDDMLVLVIYLSLDAVDSGLASAILLSNFDFFISSSSNSMTFRILMARSPNLKPK